jgi:hypothetical protein
MEKLFDTEDLIREILSKVCPYHGYHAGLYLDKDWNITISAFCHEFEQMMSVLKNNFENAPGWVPNLHRIKINTLY